MQIFSFCHQLQRLIIFIPSFCYSASRNSSVVRIVTFKWANNQERNIPVANLIKFVVNTQLNTYCSWSSGTCIEWRHLTHVDGHSTLFSVRALDGDWGVERITKLKMIRKSNTGWSINIFTFKSSFCWNKIVIPFTQSYRIYLIKYKYSLYPHRTTMPWSSVRILK